MYIIYNKYFKIRLDKFLSKNITHLSRSYIKNLILNNSVLVNNKIIIDPNFILKYNEKIEIYSCIYEKNNIKFENNININILYEDDHILLINKQYGITVDYNLNSKNKLINSLIKYYPNIINISRFGIVHRLDKNTTGLMIIAKSELSFINLKKMFLKKKIIKEYDAIISGKLISSGSIILPIIRSKKNRKIMVVDNINGKKSITHYKIVKKFDLNTYVKVIIETGRTHQIRSHMSYIGYPLVGDYIYGKNNSNFIKSNNYLKNKFINFNRQALHSSKMIFNHPINNNIMNFNIKIPNDMKFLLENI